MLPMQDL